MQLECCWNTVHGKNLQTAVIITVTIVLRGIMQCFRLVGKDEFSALIGTVGDWRAAMEKLRWPMDVFARKTNRSPRPAERSDRRDDSETGQIACLR